MPLLFAIHDMCRILAVPSAPRSLRLFCRHSAGSRKASRKSVAHVLVPPPYFSPAATTSSNFTAMSCLVGTHSTFLKKAAMPMGT